jgi:histidine triad (HIT) family protein
MAILPHPTDETNAEHLNILVESGCLKDEARASRTFKYQRSHKKRMPDAEGNYSEEELKSMSPEELATLQKANCVFCKINAKEIPAQIIYEDDAVNCFLDINPAAKGHVLVAPKEHVQILPQIPPDVFKKLFIAAQHVSQSLLKALQVEGTTIFVANGAVAGQRAPHFLIHVIPREGKDGLFKAKPADVTPEQVGEIRRVLRLNLGRFFKGDKLPPPASPQRAVAMTAPSPTKVSTASHEESDSAEDAEERESQAPIHSSRASSLELAAQAGASAKKVASPDQDDEVDDKQEEKEDDKKDDSDEDREEGKGSDKEDDDAPDESSEDDRESAAPQAKPPQAPPQNRPAKRSDLDAISNLLLGGRR